MSNVDIKASSSIMSDKQFILSYYIPEFAKFRRNEDKKRIGCESIDDSLFVLPKKDNMYFKPVTPICDKCNSRNLVKYGTYTRELIFFRYWEENMYYSEV
jgi:hypothetical protein